MSDSTISELCDGDRAATFGGAYQRRALIPPTRDDLVELFEKHADRGPDDELYIQVETAADLVVDMRAGRSLDAAVVLIALDNILATMTAHRLGQPSLARLQVLSLRAHVAECADRESHDVPTTGENR